jgi:XTP/dITP diphosphohydrolase
MKLVFATHNLNKLKEVKAMLPNSIELLSLKDIGCDEDIPETASTIEGNALIKAKYVKENYGYDCFADDTGLEVDALNNEPGVYSARYAGPENDAQANIQKLLSNLAEEKNREARFKTAISLVFDGKEKLFLGICEGKIISTQRGEGGFGYDPVFLPSESRKTMAEMSPEEKSKIGHRGKAMRQLIAFLSE